MKSDPGRSVVSTSACAGSPASASADIDGGPTRRASSCCPATAGEFAASTAAPIAAPFRKLRRSFFITPSAAGFVFFVDLATALHLRRISQAIPVWYITSRAAASMIAGSFSEDPFAGISQEFESAQLFRLFRVFHPGK